MTCGAVSRQSTKPMMKRLRSLAGDALLTRSFGILGEADLPARVRAELVTELAASGGMSGMIGGQVVDITVAEGERDEALITDLQAMKTGAH